MMMGARRHSLMFVRAAVATGGKHRQPLSYRRILPKQNASRQKTAAKNLGIRKLVVYAGNPIDKDPLCGTS
jgi:hypothetical protein